MIGMLLQWQLLPRRRAPRATQQEDENAKDQPLVSSRAGHKFA
jgi:hypothetical protein